MYRSFFRYWVCFRHSLCLRGRFGHFLRIMGVFWSYSSNRWYFDLFQAWGVLCSFSMFWGYVGQFLGFGGYFGHFLGFGVYQSFFRYQVFFGHFLCLRGHFGHFLHFMGVFWSYSSNRWRSEERRVGKECA